MPFCDRATVRRMFEGKTVAIVGSGPGVLANPPGLIDSHEVVTRINNYKLFPATGYRTDCHASFYGTSIKKTSQELKRDGVKLCLCKCPDAQFMESDWHRRHGKMNGVDFSYIYRNRREWWFTDTFVPSVEHFVKSFELLKQHIPTTGFAAVLDVLDCNPRHVYLTGFDFFSSGQHNVNERWRPGDPSDPIGHDPAAERAWLMAHYRELPITMDAALTEAVEGTWKSPPIRTQRRLKRHRSVYPRAVT